MSEIDGSYLFRMCFGVLPTVLVCFAGFIVSIIFIRRYFWSSILTLAAMVITTAIVIAKPLVQLYLIHARVDRGWTTLFYTQTLTGVEVVAGLGHALVAILLLVAVFAGRRNVPVRTS